MDGIVFHDQDKAYLAAKQWAVAENTPKIVYNQGPWVASWADTVYPNTEN